MKQKGFLFLMLAILVVGFLSTAALAADILLVAKDQEAVGFDPHKVPALSSIQIYQHVYDGLVNIDESGQIVPELATSWEIIGETTYIFKLRPGVKFHNGREMVAEDVKFSFERILNPETASIARSYFDKIKEITTPDPYTVVFELKEVYADFLNNLANVWAAIVPQEVVKEHGDLMQVACGTGPFMLNTWVPDNYTSLVKNPEYYEPDLPKVDELRYIVMKEEASRIAALRTGSVHISSITPEAATLLANQKNLRIIEYPSLNYTYWGFNLKRPPFDNPKVRLAMSYAIDRELLAQIVYAGQAKVTGPVAPGQLRWALPLESYPSYTPDPEKAKALLAEAGYPNGLSFKIKTASTYPYMIDTAVAIQHQLKQIGVDAEIELVEWGAYIDAWTNTDHDSLVGLNGSGTTPDRALHFFFRTGGTGNVWGFSDPNFDALVDKARLTVNEQERYDIYAQGQLMIVNELAPNLFLNSPNQFFAASDKVGGFNPTTTTGESVLKHVYFK